MTVLAASGLRCAYGARVVLDGVSVRVAGGEALGIIGPNGSGKSTLLRALSGVLPPAAGRVELDGRPLRAWPRAELARALAVVPQDTVIEFPFSVTEVVLMGRAPHLGRFALESARDLAIAREAMARTGVLDLADRSILELSGGERQRVVLARALAQQARVLLLDEPAAHLDIRHEVEIYDLLADLQRDGAAVVTVLHDLNLAALYCTHVVLLAAGRVAAAGTPAEVITYAHVTRVYGTEVYVDLNAITGAVNVLPLSRPYREALRRGPAGDGRA